MTLPFEKVRIGMRVKGKNFINERFKKLNNRLGTVIRITEYKTIGIAFDERFSYGHNCDGTCKNGYGRYFSEKESPYDSFNNHDSLNNNLEFLTVEEMIKDMLE
jgi:hypothetical protein